MTPHVNRLDVRGKKSFFKTETQHENTRAKMITIKLIETEALEQVKNKFSGGNLVQKILPRTDSTEKVTKNSFKSGHTKSSIGRSKL